MPYSGGDCITTWELRKYRDHIVHVAPMGHHTSVSINCVYIVFLSVPLPAPMSNPGDKHSGRAKPAGTHSDWPQMISN